MRQIGAFRSFRSDSTRLRHCRMSWMMSKGWAAVFLYHKTHIKYFTFFTFIADYARQRGHRIRAFDRAIATQRPKCVNSAQAETKVYETVRNRRVKNSFRTLTFARRVSRFQVPLWDQICVSSYCFLSEWLMILFGISASKSSFGSLVQPLEKQPVAQAQEKLRSALLLQSRQSLNISHILVSHL